MRSACWITRATNTPSECVILVFPLQQWLLEGATLLDYMYVHCLSCLNSPFKARQGSSVGIVTDYGLDGPGIQSRWGQDFPHLSRPAWGPPSSLYNGYRLFPGGKERPGRDADPSPLLVPWSRKSRAIPLLPPMGHTACTEPLPVQYSYTSTPPLWAIRPVQSLCLYKGALYLLYL